MWVGLWTCGPNHQQAWHISALQAPHQPPSPDPPARHHAGHQPCVEPLRGQGRLSPRGAVGSRGRCPPSGAYLLRLASASPPKPSIMHEAGPVSHEGGPLRRRARLRAARAYHRPRPLVARLLPRCAQDHPHHAQGLSDSMRALTGAAHEAPQTEPALRPQRCTATARHGHCSLHPYRPPRSTLLLLRWAPAPRRSMSCSPSPPGSSRYAEPARRSWWHTLHPCHSPRLAPAIMTSKVLTVPNASALAGGDEGHH
jgi:hypothetical protein